jgi:Peptidase M15
MATTKISSIEDITETTLLSDVPAPIIWWMQRKLLHGGYLAGPNSLTGKMDATTIAAFKEFKRVAAFLNDDYVGRTALEYLGKVSPPHTTSEQVRSGRVFSVNPDAGQLTGKSVFLPGGERVHENEFVLGKIQLTWGEVTHGLDRVPKNKEALNNIYEIARIFGSIRLKFGYPIAVASGYRSLSCTAGAMNSLHRQGRALDLVPLNNHVPGQMERFIRVCKTIPAIGGIGVGNGFVHVDNRDRVDGVLSIWFYRE